MTCDIAWVLAMIGINWIQVYKGHESGQLDGEKVALNCVHRR